MPLKNNILIHSTAGSGKTTCLVKVALNNADKKILITTYTRNNTQEIKNKFVELNGYVPKNVEITTWETFLLKNCIRPYQNLMGFEDRIYQVYFTNKDPHLKVSSNGKYYYTIKKSNDIQGYYLTSNGRIYSCKITEFADDCHKTVKGKMLQRIEECYDYVFVDEAQDFAGYDFEIMNLILKSKKIKSIIVADKRQNTFDTHYSRKNRKYAENIIEWFKFLENKKLAKLNYLNNTWRCNQHICDIADSLYPELPKSISKNKITTEHDGLFYVKNENLKKYLNRYKPVVLVYGKNSCNDLKTSIKTMNFGISKGLTFDRVLIKPTEKIMNFLKYGSIPEKAKEKLYIAITRARYSVGFIVPNDVDLDSFYNKKIVEWNE